MTSHWPIAAPANVANPRNPGQLADQEVGSHVRPATKRIRRSNADTASSSSVRRSRAAGIVTIAQIVSIRDTWMTVDLATAEAIATP